MYISTSFITTALLGLATATSSSLAASETMAAAAAASGAASAGTVVTHVVQVGGANGSLIFSPNNVIAQPGELVQFQFNQKNHSVVQSTFAQPCVPIQNVMPNKTDAFFSGFMPTNRTFGSTSTAGMLSYTIRVMDTTPIWVYCAQAKHCQTGMVGAINAPTSGNKTVAAFAALAASATENLSPGQAAGAASSNGNGAASSVGTDGAGATQTGASGATATSANSPAQQTTNAAPGFAPQSFLGLAVAALAAFLAL